MPIYLNTLYRYMLYNSRRVNNPICLYAYILKYILQLHDYMHHIPYIHYIPYILYILICLEYIIYFPILIYLSAYILIYFVPYIPYMLRSLVFCFMYSVCIPHRTLACWYRSCECGRPSQGSIFWKGGSGEGALRNANLSTL